MGRSQITFFAAYVASAFSSSALAQETAEYRVTLDATWSVTSHPDAFPPQAHFSPFIGAVHDETLSLWSPGGMASQGMEDMAEDGSTTFLSLDILSARSQGRATEILRGPFLNAGAAGGDTFVAVDTHTKLSVVSMIAPSPDWFVGVDSFELRPNGQWVNRVEVVLHAYDAGTDSGTGFLSPNLDTQPQEPITDFQTTAPFSGTPHVAVLIVERLDVPCLADVNTDGEVNGLDFGAWLGAFNAGAPIADQNEDGEINGLDFGAWLGNFNAGCE